MDDSGNEEGEWRRRRADLEKQYGKHKFVVMSNETFVVKDNYMDAASVKAERNF